MHGKKGFTLIEPLVVIAVIALLMAILMPALHQAKKQALTAACQGQLKQWALILATYTNGNNGYFRNRPSGTDYQKMWPDLFQPCHSDPMRRCRPAARNSTIHSGPFGTWGWVTGATDPKTGRNG